MNVKFVYYEDHSVSSLILVSTLLYSHKFENLAKIPPMGWSSWNRFGSSINEGSLNR